MKFVRGRGPTRGMHTLAWFGRNALLVLLYPTGCPSRRNRRHPSQRALNSAVECHLHTVEVAGSNPAAPTIESITYDLVLWTLGSIW
jgi:hypothetical protein